MNFYEATVRFKETDLPLVEEARKLFPDAGEENEKRWMRDKFEEVNECLGVKCDSREAFSIFICEAKRGEIRIIFSVDTDIAGLDEAKQFIKDFLESGYEVCEVEFSCVSEISTGRFHKLGERADNNGLLQRFRCDETNIGTDYRENCQYLSWQTETLWCWKWRGRRSSIGIMPVPMRK